MPLLKRKPPLSEISRGALSVDEFAQRFGFSRAYVYELGKRGQLRIRKAGKRTIITTEDEREWLASLPTFGAAPESPAA
jgi:excisionase family DNA binding protein